MFHVLLNEGFELRFHLFFSFRMFPLQVVPQGGISAVGVETGDLLSVKLEEPFSLIVHIHAVLVIGGPCFMVRCAEEVLPETDDGFVITQVTQYGGIDVRLLRYGVPAAAEGAV